MLWLQHDGEKPKFQHDGEKPKFQHDGEKPKAALRDHHNILDERQHAIVVQALLTLTLSLTLTLTLTINP
jgi:hypothetical protein